MKIIDSHVHFFNLAQGDYHWLKPENAPFWPDKALIAKSVNEENLALKGAFSLAGFVHIEAGYNNQFPWQEIHWLEQSCQLPFRSVAAINLTLPSAVFADHIKQLLGYSSVVGCRHLLDEQALSLLTNLQVQKNFAVLNANHLTFDVQMPFSNLQAVNALNHVINNNPNIQFIINHAGMPPSTTMADTSATSLWYQGLAIIAQHRNVAIKCSGWEMINRHYQAHWCEHIINHCLTLFGFSRVMLSSNFPLTLLSANYQHYWETILQLPLKNLTDLSYKNSKTWYKIS